MTIISEQGFEITDAPDTNRPMSRKAKKRAAAKARREAAAAARAEAATDVAIEPENDVEVDSAELERTADTETDVAVEAEEVSETETEVETEVEVEDELEPEAAVAVAVEVEPEAAVAVEVEVEVDAEIAIQDDLEPDDETEIEAAAEDEVEAEDIAEVEDTVEDEDTAEDEVGDDEISDVAADVAPVTDDAPDLGDEDVDVEIEEQPAEAPADEAASPVEPAAAPVHAEPAVDNTPPAAGDTGGVWTGQQLVAVAQRVIAVFVVLGLVGYGVGFLRGGGNTARAEFVYTLDESVPDSFLREDRRLLTQVVTFESDAVLTPVAAEFDLTVDELRAKIDIDTLNLSEVLRLDVHDQDADQAVALNQAVLDQYLQVIADASPAGDGEELADRRAAVSAELELADAARLDLLKSQEQDVTLQLQQENLQQRISAKNEQVGALQQDLDAAIIQQVGPAQQATVANTLAAAEADLAALEDRLIDVGTQRAELATATTTEPALLREIERLEAKLTTIDNELAERELAPLVASPIRELSEPIVLPISRHLGGLQGMALGLFLAMPIGALVAFRARKQQLWFD